MGGGVCHDQVRKGTHAGSRGAGLSGAVGTLRGTVPGNPRPPTRPRTQDEHSSRADRRLLGPYQKHSLLSF